MLPIQDIPVPHGISQSTLLRFLSKIELVEECWEWRGAHKTGTAKSYGFFAPDGKSRLAHRVAYEWWVGPLQPGLDIDHLCCNSICVNPKHLEQVTRRENLMKSEGITALNSQKVTCPRGHPYSHTNSQGRRVCRICDRETLRRSRVRKRNQS